MLAEEEEKEERTEIQAGGGWCSFPSNYQNCGSCPNCPGGWRSGNCWTGGGDVETDKNVIGGVTVGE